MNSAERREKPPGLDERQAEVFLTEGMAQRYRFRPPQPAGVADVILSLLGEDGGAILDIGCGTGELGRALVDAVERVDLVDVSAAMIAEGQAREGGDHPRLRWIRARVEDAELTPPYRMAVAGDSLDWVDWYATLPRLHDALTPDGLLVIVHREWGTGAPEERDLLVRYSTNPDYTPYNLVQELASRRLFELDNYLYLAGTWTPTVEEYVESRHAQAACSRERLTGEQATAFDAELTSLLHRLTEEGRLRTHEARLRVPVKASVAWGRPTRGPA